MYDHSGLSEDQKENSEVVIDLLAMRRQLGLDRMLWMPDTLAMGYERTQDNA